MERYRDYQVHLPALLNNVRSLSHSLTFRGASDPDNVIYLGNHRDGWRFGTVDPSSGTSVLLEVILLPIRFFFFLFSLFLRNTQQVARGLTTIMNTTQWRPSRTIQFCSWDAEEFAFIGSTKYVEDNIAKLSTGAIAYMNVDIGNFRILYAHYV